MLGKSDATPMIAVKDLDRARKFYEEKLGLKEVDDFGEGFMLKSGDTKLSVYSAANPGRGNWDSTRTIAVKTPDGGYRIPVDQDFLQVRAKTSG